MTIDIARARAETPGTQHVMHFNNAGAGLMPTAVINAVKDHIDLEATRGGYEANAIAKSLQDRAYSAVAELINASPDEIAMVENATAAWLMAFHAMIRDFQPGDKILTVEAEYAANYVSYLQAARDKGIEIVVIPSDEAGAADLGALENLIDDKVKLISVTHVPTNGGLVNPAVEIGAIAKRAGVLYLLDACQSVGQLPVDVTEIGCDALSVTGRKYLRGPRGTGFLYMRKDLLLQLEPAYIDHSAAVWTDINSYELVKSAKRFENWEFYVAGFIGLGVAVDYALEWGIVPISERINSLADKLRDDLSAISGVTVTDIGHQKCGITTFVKVGVDPQDIKARLSEQNINVSVSRHDSTLIDMTRRGLTQIVRASVHYYNDEAEIERFCEAVEAL
jgi:cysteine desulfurase/selenocysteine lyase